MWASIIAVIGTLAGGLMTGLVQARLSRSARQDERANARRERQLTAVTALVAALADHRRAMWVREDLRLSGATDEAVQNARAISHDTRSAITTPLTTVLILAPALTSAANEAAAATYAMRNAADSATLATFRQSAIDASDALVAAAGRHFA